MAGAISGSTNRPITAAPPRATESIPIPAQMQRTRARKRPKDQVSMCTPVLKNSAADPNATANNVTAVSKRQGRLLTRRQQAPVCIADNLQGGQGEVLGTRPKGRNLFRACRYSDSRPCRHPTAPAIASNDSDVEATKAAARWQPAELRKLQVSQSAELCRSRRKPGIEADHVRRPAKRQGRLASEGGPGLWRKTPRPKESR